MKRQRHLHKILTGTLILTLSTLIAKVLSASYRIPFQNLVGDTGFYVYQQVYPLYGIGVTLALSGLPVFISKLVAERRTQIEKETLVQQLVVILSVLAILLVLFSWLLAPWLAQLMGDKNLAPVIQSVALMFIFMPILAVSRGYWQGKYNMIPTAISQLIEQVVRVSIVISVALVASRQHWNVYKMGTFAMGSAFVAGLIASLFLLPTIWRILRHAKINQLTTTVPWLLIKRLLVEGGVVCLFAGMVVLFQLVDSFTVKRGLVSGGLAPTYAKALKGVFDRGQPLIQLGLVVATAFTATLLPSLTASRLRHNIVEFRRVYRSALHLCIAMSLFATAGLITLMPQINQLLFVNSVGSLALAISMTSIVLVALITTYSSVLQSLNQFYVTMFGLFGGLIIKLLVNFYLVRHLGIVGAALGTIIGLTVTLIIIRSSLPSQLKQLTMDRRFQIKLLGICILMGVCAKLTCVLGLYIFGTSRLAMIPIVAISVIIGCSVVLVLVAKWQLFSIKEIVTFPGGKRLLKLINKSKS
ncbi:putative polysaccharide biosynthesis protein [Paucilactobacillus kaifaensis]|uniref:putative polysaccharide biosynthesis protein n=1 Tax=Paucilactobacillus kaifaensis TaxID=2559921 RepID=UPI001484DFB3|nr:oligosaccharide flippase family protein [Paucilactobacillus kaifaensis]